ncbi:DUF1376 domain-containing protein [Rhizobium sp. 18065]|uniref:DUF1376 domain-containing protein n=1 Tax=Rhizobium sp. 18065 TaxID=2681411 RepID=UPI00135A1291|nr:DUF1376 domain-containing protein [Rhizobium sp. 18065]
MSRRSMPYHRRYHQDALQGYRKLSLEERGAYTTILDLIYDEGGPIENNERWLAGELNCSLRKARVIVAELIELRKLYVTSTGKISNHRAEQELENSLKISRKCAENVSKREEKKRDRSKITNNINQSSQRRIIDRSTIPYTSTRYNISNPEYDVASDPETEPLEHDAVSGTDADEPPSPVVDSEPPKADHLIRALEGQGHGRAALHQMLSQRRHQRSH